MALLNQIVWRYCSKEVYLYINVDFKNIFLNKSHILFIFEIHFTQPQPIDPTQHPGSENPGTSQPVVELSAASER